MLIKEIINSENATTMERGYLLYKEIMKKIEKDEAIELDFQGLKLITSQFFNASISLLLKDYKIEVMQNKLKMINLPDYARNLLNISIGNAINHFNKG